MVELSERKLVETAEDSIVASVRASLEETGVAPPPVMHMFCDELEAHPYVGYAMCPPADDGRDPAMAVRGLGVLASMLAASRLLLGWEQADLADLLGRTPRLPTGVVVLDAERGARGHVVRWRQGRPEVYPGAARRAVGGPDAGEDQAWAPVQIIADASIPDPVRELLGFWRERRTWPADVLLETLTAMEHCGYRIRWAQRPDDEDPSRGPDWLRILGAA